MLLLSLSGRKVQWQGSSLGSNLTISCFYSNRHVQKRMLCEALIWIALAHSQPDSLKKLRAHDTAWVFANRQEAVNIGHNVRSISAEWTGIRSADLLQNQTTLFVKRSGNTGVATATSQGASAAQTGVLWNGIPLRSPMLGLTDLSLINTDGLERLEWVSGSTAAGWGSGFIGGSLHIQTQPRFNQKTMAQAQLTAGAFGFLHAGAKTHLGDSNFYFQTAVYREQAKNNYLYENYGVAGSPIEHLKNSEYALNTFRWGIGWKKKFVTQHINGEWNIQDRNIPSSILEVPKNTFQQDRSLRLLYQNTIRWNRFLKSQTKLAWMYEWLRFNENSSNLDEVSWSHQQYLQQEFSYKKRNASFQFGHDINRALAQTEAYAGKKIQWIHASYASVTYPFKKWILNGFTRWEWREMVPIIQGAFQRSFENHTLKGHFGNSFRRPTLNDLYWNPGGNPELQSETGWGGELHDEYFLKRKQYHIYIGFGGFYRKLKNAIQWLPGASYWSPVNYQTLVNKGFEGEFKWEYFHKHGNIFIKSQSAFTHSTIPNENKETYFQIYVPQWKFIAQLGATYKNWTFYTGGNYTSARFITTDNSSLMPSFYIQDAVLKYQFNKQFISYFTIFLGIENIWNTPYENIPGRPMPGRWWKCGISLQLEKQTP